MAKKLQKGSNGLGRVGCREAVGCVGGAAAIWEETPRLTQEFGEK